MTHKRPSMRISHLLPALTLFAAFNYSSVSAQTINVNSGVSFGGVVNTSPRPTFNFTISPSYRGFTSFLLTWGTGTKKDGIVIKRVSFTDFSVTDINKTGSVVTPDPIQDIYAFSFDHRSGRIKFVRDWKTSDTVNDVPLVKGVPNSFQWEAVIAGVTYKGSFTSDLNLVVLP